MLAASRSLWLPDWLCAPLMFAHLKKSASTGHLLKTSTGHLTKDCGVGFVCSPWPSGASPSSFTAVTSGFTNGTQTLCANANRTWTLEPWTEPGEACVWISTVSIAIGTNPTVNGEVYLRVIIDPGLSRADLSLQQFTGKVLGGAGTEFAAWRTTNMNAITWSSEPFTLLGSNVSCNVSGDAHLTAVP